MSDDYSRTTYTIPFIDFYCSSTGSAAAADLWSIKCTTSGRTRLVDVNIGQLSTNTAGNQQLSVQIQRGTTALGSGISATPVNTKGWTGVTTAGAVAYAPSSTSLASTASATVVYADNTDWSGNWTFPDTDDWGSFIFDPGQNFVIRVSTPPVGVYLSGTAVIEELPLKMR